MSLRVARETIMQEEFDSGSLTPLCSVIHFVQEAGLYIGQVSHGKEVVGTFRMQAVAEGAALQTNVNLATVRGTQAEARRVNAPGGVVFYSSFGTIGYSVKLWRTEGGRRELEFDSQKLGDEDLFAVTLLHPGDYEVADERDGSLCRLYVGERKPAKKPYRPPAPAIAGLGDRAMSEATSAPLSPAQTQVFRAEGHARIKVRLADNSRAQARGKSSGKAEWRKEPE